MLGLAEGYRLLQQPDRVIQALDQALNNPKVDAGIMLQLANAYGQANNLAKVEETLDKLVKIAPDLPESWYNLAALKTRLNKPQEAISAVRRALELSDKRLKQDPKSPDLAAKVQQDPQFAALRQDPEFQKLAPRK